MLTRRIVTPALVFLLVPGVVSCNAAFSKREMVVNFSSTATPQQHAAARTACTGVAPHTSPEPIVHDQFASSRVSDIRFRVDKANDHDLAKLFNCLSRQPGVVGVSDPMDSTR